MNLYGNSLIMIYERLRAIGLTSSRASFSTTWCGRDAGYARDLTRREGAVSRVSQKTIDRIRGRLAEARQYLPRELADEVTAIDAAITQHMRVADLLGRRSIEWASR